MCLSSSILYTVHTYIHTYTHTHTHTYIYIYIYTKSDIIYEESERCRDQLS